tara:strand:+ start:466 stop:567 length:102 start_codon:yes stop_codon:yes gene_type:complete
VSIKQLLKALELAKANSDEARIYEIEQILSARS